MANLRGSKVVCKAPRERQGDRSGYLAQEEMPIVRITNRIIADSVPAIPRPVVRRIAGRYMAGERLHLQADREGRDSAIRIGGPSVRVCRRDLARWLEERRYEDGIQVCRAR